MTSEDKYVVVYNTTNDAIPIDEEGRVVASREWAAVCVDDVSEFIANDRLLVVDHNLIDHMSTPIAWEAKQRRDKLAAGVPAKTDYDESTEETADDTGRSSSKRRK
jgi:hypothetical protein